MKYVMLVEEDLLMLASKTLKKVEILTGSRSSEILRHLGAMEAMLITFGVLKIGEKLKYKTLKKHWFIFEYTTQETYSSFIQRIMKDYLNLKT